MRGTDKLSTEITGFLYHHPAYIRAHTEHRPPVRMRGLGLLFPCGPDKFGNFPLIKLLVFRFLRHQYSHRKLEMPNNSEGRAQVQTHYSGLRGRTLNFNGLSYGLSSYHNLYWFSCYLETNLYKFITCQLHSIFHYFVLIIILKPNVWSGIDFRLLVPNYHSTNISCTYQVWWRGQPSPRARVWVVRRSQASSPSHASTGNTALLVGARKSWLYPR